MVLDFGLISSGLFPESDASGSGMGSDYTSQIVWNDVGVGIVPIGAVVAWIKSLAGCPPLLPNFVECNGQILADGDSPLNGQVIPDLNGYLAAPQRFLRGGGNGDSSATSSGAIATNETHTHNLYFNEKCSKAELTVFCSLNSYLTTTAGNSLPSYYEVVWVMRIK